MQNAAHSAAGVRSVDHRCEVAAAAAALASFAAASVAAFAATVSSIRARSALPPLTVDEPASALTSAAAAASERWVRLRVPTLLLLLLWPVRWTSSARRNAEHRAEHARWPRKQLLERVARSGRLAGSSLSCSVCDCRWVWMQLKDETCAEYLDARCTLRTSQVDEQSCASQPLVVVAGQGEEHIRLSHSLRFQL